jgi:MtN3 and saliva related transmembrane protein
MQQSSIYEICGIIVSMAMILGYLPQAIKTIRTHKTDGIALPTFLMMAIGGACFMMQGLLHKPSILWALFLTNLVTTTCSIIVFSIKVYNDYIAPRKRGKDGGDNIV